MRLFAKVLAVLLASASISLAQTGFSTKTYPVNQSTNLRSADFNHDGKADLLVFGKAAGAVYLNNGSGGFGAPFTLPGTGTMTHAAIGDMNGDGSPDIVGCVETGTGSSATDSVVVYLNDGAGKFAGTTPQPVPGFCTGLVLGDVDHTGRLAVVTVGYVLGGPKGGDPNAASNQIVTWLNDGTGHISEKQDSGTGFDDPTKSSAFTNCGVSDVIGGDFLQNGQFSLLIAADCKELGQTNPPVAGTLYLGSGTGDVNSTPTGYFNFSHLSSFSEYLFNGHTFDVNADGRPDGLFPSFTGGSNSNLEYFRNDGSGSFSTINLGQYVSSTLAPTQFRGSALADFTGDGINDVATSFSAKPAGNSAAASSSYISILAGSSSGSFSESQHWLIGPDSTSTVQDVLSDDFNGDGKPDIAALVANPSTGATTLYIYEDQAGSSSGCSAPSQANTNVICAPAEGSTVGSPVTVTAASNVTGFTLNRLYLDNNSVYQSTSQSISTPINMADGAHNLVLVSYNNKGQAFDTRTSFTVGAGGNAGCVPSAPGASICAPTPGSSEASPVTITAGALAQSGNITAIRAYIDNVAVLLENNPSPTRSFQISQAVNVASGGSHNLVIVGYQSTGGVVQKGETFSTTGNAPCYPSTSGAIICSPANGTTVTSPFTVSAGATAPSGYITAIRIYVDNVAKALVNNPQKSKSFAIQQSLSLAAGTHRMVVVAYDSAGGTATAVSTIDVH